MKQTNWRRDLADTTIQRSLRPRNCPYFNLISYCRHIGLHVTNRDLCFWVARVRRRDGGYSQRRLSCAWRNGDQITSYDVALLNASEWFEAPDIRAIAAEPYQVGSKRSLSICPIGNEISVGHALEAYLDWKRIAATKSHFETLVSLINYHLVPRASSVPLESFNGVHFHELALAVMETPPKRGNCVVGPRVPIRNLAEEELRKRKKTLNALVSILRGAFDLAWERDMLRSDRPMRCLRRVPNADRPRVVFLDRNECRCFLSACHPDLHKLVLAALYTGCRANELIQMNVGDYLPRECAVFVASPKGRKTRHVFLPPEGSRFFQSIVGKRPSNERMFRKSNGRVWGSEYKTYFQVARTESGLPGRLTFHGLRHTYASQLIAGGASLITVADQLGHIDTQTVSSTYGHLTATQREGEVARCFERLIGSDDAVEEAARVQVIAKGPMDNDRIPAFKHREASSWPRSNFSRFSGELLAALSPHSDISNQ